MYPGGVERMQLVAGDIVRATDSKLHTVVVTHEHTDHLYGFKYARDKFDEIKIDDLWLAWTENPADPIAQNLKDLCRRRVKALSTAIDRLHTMNEPLADSLNAVLEFEPLDLAARGEESAELNYLRKKSNNHPGKSEDYCVPGEAPRTLPEVKGVKVYVLGPPKNITQLKTLQKEGEIYPELTTMDELEAFSAALMAAPDATSEEARRFRRSCPFDSSLEILKCDAACHPHYGQFFKKYYGFADDEEQSPAWRRIENDWIASAGGLALKINERTNNTSLVLAIELTQTRPRKVLLFAADAQVGNWLSWHKLCWPGDGQDGEVITGMDLLKRTVFYKVGHHGSRNATLRQNGLEIMDSTDLVAVIPVDEKWAKNEMHWEHPAEKLLSRLEEKARSRVVRTDRIPPEDGLRKESVGNARSDWQAFVRQLDWDRSSNKLWIQYTVTG
jgi:hypothetical protein